MDRVLLVLGVLALAVVVGLVWRSRNGRFTPVPPSVLAAPSPDAADGQSSGGPAAGGAGGTDGRRDDRLTAAEIGAPLGAVATFVQLSSEVCTPCRRTHAVLAAVADEHDGVSHVDLDVAQHLDLVRRFGVMRTPTVLLLDASGAVVGRMSGATDRRQALAALDSCRRGVAPR
ncbi:thioredoxin family protein [Cellulomonas fimi]|uniref:thioredoxin family protein n=1 Tax=Cellulomonas fimi TaxID=1708 RepID=UPI00234CB0C7|nr:thioredoxin family protein [Cellulomonas fimi]MDC7122848.1 thioredoxin family protein [Cellulomonas fimi]